jgi:CRISPR-associated protein Cmr3
VNIFTLAKKRDGDAVLPFFPLPADVVAQENTSCYLYPRRPHPNVSYGTPAPLPMLPVLRQETPKKPAGGHWLNRDGLVAYLAGEPIGNDLLVDSDTLWKNDPRLGIAMETECRTIEKGRIYTTETVAVTKDIGFLVGVDGADGCLPQEGLLRFGGDGRGATVQVCRSEWPASPWTRIAKEKRFRLVLSTPGLFPDGWRLPGFVEKKSSLVWHSSNFTARLVAAAINRAEVVSGWDIARHSPKPAQRMAPTGSVYWFDSLEGDLDGLEEFVKNGLWPLIENQDAARRAEGFNNVLVAAWPQD